MDAQHFNSVYTLAKRKGFNVRVRKGGTKTGECSWMLVDGHIGKVSIIVRQDSEEKMLWRLLHEIGHALNVINGTVEQRQGLFNTLNAFHADESAKVSSLQMADEEDAWTNGEAFFFENFGINLCENKKYLKEKERCLNTYRRAM